MAVATGTVGPVSTGPLFGRKIMNIQYNEALNCLFRAHVINLLPRGGRHVLNIALMATKESLPTLSVQPHHPKAGFAFPKRSFGKPKLVFCSVQS